MYEIGGMNIFRFFVFCCMQSSSGRAVNCLCSPPTLVTFSIKMKLGVSVWIDTVNGLSLHRMRFEKLFVVSKDGWMLTFNDLLFFSDLACTL